MSFEANYILAGSDVACIWAIEFFNQAENFGKIEFVR